jgi:peroxiredoxin (alkyl hydroperoxide reductase subunit C)
MLTVGDKLPRFELKAVVSIEEGKQFQEIDDTTHTNKWRVIFFWPMDFTFVCPTEIAEFGRRHADFVARDAQVLGVSTDSHYVHLAWRKEHPDLKSIPFPMLADTKRELSTAMGVLHKTEGVPLRATFIVDHEGIIRWASASDLGVGRSIPEVLRVLDAFETGELCPVNWEKGRRRWTRRDRLRPAQRPERVALFLRERRERPDRGAGRSIEEWVRPRSSPELPAEQQSDDARDHPCVRQRRGLGRPADRELVEDPTARLAEDLVAAASVGRAPEELVRDAHERDRRCQRVAERRFAAARVPAVEPLRAETDTRDLLGSALEDQGRGRDLDDLGSAVLVEEIGAAEVMKERLAVVAVADDAVHLVGHGVAQAPPNLSATTRELEIVRHRGRV